MKIFNKDIARKYVVAGVCGLVLLLALGFVAFMQYYRLEKKNFLSNDGKEHGYFIYPDMSMDSVLALVSQDYSIFSTYSLDWYTKHTNLHKIEEGFYRFPATMSTRYFVHRIKSGTQTPINLSFTNQIRTRQQLAKRLAKQLLIDSAQIMTLLDSTDYIAKFGFNQYNITCMFIPNTYEVFWTTSAEDLFERMYREYNVFWNDKRREEAKDMGLTPIEVCILGSIAESETNKTFEYPIIAQLYLNRLHRRMPLQACPTIIFAWGNFSMRRVLDKHLNIKSPYNTYKNLGFPPGPIRLTNASTMDAILHSEPNKYLYMCANPEFDGTHIFSSTFAEHKQNARKYQRELNKRHIKK